jgi:hypothetical protein
MINRYLCFLIGEDARMLPRFHRSTLERIQAFGVAIHIPVALWIVTSYVVASEIFELEKNYSIGVSIFCGTLVYLLERLVISVPKAWFVNVLRVLIGVLVAILASSTFDLVMFKKEIATSLEARAEEKVTSEYLKRRQELESMIEDKRSAWDVARSQANCEANGTCGSGKASLGPIYRELAKQAEVLRSDYLEAAALLEPLEQDKLAKLEKAKASAQRDAGLLERMEALQAFLRGKPHAQAFWGVLFALVLALELVVVFTKSAFSKETVDDHIRRVSEKVSRVRADNYYEATIDPVARAEALLEQEYGLA